MGQNHSATFIYYLYITNEGMKRNEALREAFRQSPHLHRRYTVLSAILFVEIVVLLLAYVFFF